MENYSHSVLRRGGEPKQLGEVMAAYLSTSDDSLARAFRTAYDHLTNADRQESALPPKNDYVALVRYVRQQAHIGIDWYVRAKGNRSEMARILSPVVGWTIDVNSMCRAERRMQKKKRPI